MQSGNGHSSTMLAAPITKYEPLAPIGDAGALKSLLERQRDGIAHALPRHVTPERIIKTLLVAANRTPDLLQCTQASILETINRAAELGLDLSGTLGEAYPVPFNNKVRDRNGRESWTKQCQLIIGYRGFVKLARQSGEIKRIDADVVCENDDFVFRKGSDARCEFIPNLRGDRGKPVGAYAFVEFKDGATQFDFMPFEDIEKVRRRSKSGSNRDGDAIGAWRSDWEEMAKKTVFRRVAKWLPLSTEKFVAALEQDGADYELSDVLEAQTGKAAGRHSRAAVKQFNEASSDRQLPDTQLSDEEAERVIQQKAAQANGTPSPTAEPDAVSGQPEGEFPDDGQFIPEAEPEAPSDGPVWPAKLPPHARTSKGWIDDMIPYRKPENMTAHQARTAFHKTHNPSSWEKLGHDVQDAMYQELREGSFDF